MLAAAAAVRLRGFWQPEAAPLPDDFEPAGPTPSLRRMPSAIGDSATPRPDGAANSPLTSPAKMRAGVGGGAAAGFGAAAASASASASAAAAASAAGAAGAGSDSDEDDLPLTQVTHAKEAKAAAAEALAAQPAGRVREDGALASLAAAVRVLLAAHPSEAITAYAKLQPEAKLALLVALVDAATDTKSANTAAEAKHNERVRLEGAWEAQDKEEKKAARREKEHVRATVRAILEQQLPNPN